MPTYRTASQRVYATSFSNRSFPACENFAECVDPRCRFALSMSSFFSRSRLSQGLAGETMRGWAPVDLPLPCSGLIGGRAQAAPIKIPRPVAAARCGHLDKRRALVKADILPVMSAAVGDFCFVFVAPWFNGHEVFISQHCVVEMNTMNTSTVTHTEITQLFSKSIKSIFTVHFNQ